MIARRPAEFIAQQQVQLSTHPTVARGRLEPRRVDLRPFVVRAVGGYSMLPASLTRYAASAESLHVNSSLGGGGKDTWVIA